MSFEAFYENSDNPSWKKFHGTLWDGTKIYKVDGNYVRSRVDGGIQFVEGGHSLVYKWMPKNEIWFEDMKNNIDEKENLVHEIYEYTLMKYINHMLYDTAHEKSNNVELLIRKI